ncbi:peroxiredoxin [Nocardioides panacis]|uniref:peroxiredoxin n=1 Tax=Nocardioides panacis TaxID=2849501 RepID=UPI00265FB095|nr:peroxiredoxin [Nocardioides panacis]
MKTIAEGTRAPDFELPDENGNPVRLSVALADGPVVLFFYPVALSGGCTKQACHFRDLATEFKELGAQRFGISTDSVAKQKEFSEANGFDYPLLSDESGEVATSLGVEAEVHHPRGSARRS